MEAGDFFFGRRIRQNHALEHATVTILARRLPELRVSARSNSKGFVIYADLDLNEVRQAVDEGLRRLRAGERELAIHPNCGTNLAVGTSVAMVGSLFAFTAVRTRTRIASALASTAAGFVVARPLGRLVQRHVTTLPDLDEVAVGSIARRVRLGFPLVEVRTRVV